MILMVEEETKKPKIMVCGVGGAGCNAIDSMQEKIFDGVDFLVVNTDLQVLGKTKTENRLHIGHGVTKGMGTGANPLLGEQAAEEDREAIREALSGVDLLFLTCGLGGGTGTGATPVIADIAREMGALTVAIATKPFAFEGAVRQRHAERGQVELRSKVDTLISIPNERLLAVADEKTPLVEAFKISDCVLAQCVQSFSDLITQSGLINLDFADIRAIMSNTGGAVMGVGFGKGRDNRALESFRQASSSPLMEEEVLKGAKGILINVTGGNDLTLHEINRAIAEVIKPAADADANIIFGVVIDERMSDEIQVTILATGFGVEAQHGAGEDDEENEDQQALFSSNRPGDEFQTPAFLRNRELAKEFAQAQGQDFGTEEAPIPLSKRAGKADVLPAIFGG